MIVRFVLVANVFLIVFLISFHTLPLNLIEFHIQSIPNIELSPFIDVYESLEFDSNQIKQAILKAENPVRIKFDRIYDRSYTFDLWLDTSFYDQNDLVIDIIGRNGSIVNNDRSINYFFTGHDVDNELVKVIGSICTDDWTFEGEISRFHGYQKIIIEPIKYYLNKDQIVQYNIDYKSIIYFESDVRRNWLKSNESLRYRRWMLPPIGYDEEDAENTWWPPNMSSQPVDTTIVFSDENRSSKNLIKNYLIYKHKGRLGVNKKKTTCLLYLQADHLLFNKFGSKKAVIETLMRHVQRLNFIYNDIDFDSDGEPDKINFIVKRIKVYTSEAVEDANYRFAQEFASVEKFLETFSEENYNAFCLAYMFTYRDFEMGTLGLAWTGDVRNAGGVCERYGHYRGSMKSLNTGIVTLLNYGKFVPSIISHITFAHEIGHNFGSPHDPPNCIPGGKNGNFIMYSRATPGNLKNNYQFSPCSIASINSVLNLKARSQWFGCFREIPKSLCGNGIVESDEECDCGWEDDCKDECCFPQRAIAVVNEQPCKLRPNKMCSPTQGPCCTSDCRLKFAEKCKDDNGCRSASFCDGWSAKCPKAMHKPNRTKCLKDNVCFMGECTSSICLAYGLELCQCNEPDQLCHLCCKLPGRNQTCISSFYWPNSSISLPQSLARRGATCNNYQGYCDHVGRCRDRNPTGPLATIKNLIFTTDSFLKFWYIFLVVLTILIIFVSCCCSSNNNHKSHKATKKKSSSTKKSHVKRTKSTVSSLSQKIKSKVLKHHRSKQSHHVSSSHHPQKNQHHKKPKIKTTKTGPARSKKLSSNPVIVEHPVVSISALPLKNNHKISKSKKSLKKSKNTTTTNMNVDIKNKVDHWLIESQKELKFDVPQTIENDCDIINKHTKTNSNNNNNNGNSNSNSQKANVSYYVDISQPDDINSNLDTVQSDLDVLISKC